MPPAPTPEQKALRGFVQRVEKDPDDIEAWLGYGKLLAGKRDVRGESIMRWHEKREFDAFVGERAKDLFGEHASDVGADRLFRPHWHMGFVQGLRVTVPNGARHDVVRDRLCGVLKQPVFLLLRELRVELVGGGDSQRFVAQVRPTTIHNLRTVGLAGITDLADRWPADLIVDWSGIQHGKSDTSAYGGGPQTFGPTNLERLEVTGRFKIIDWVGKSLPPQLRELHLQNDNFLPEDFFALAQWPLSKVERLELWLVGRGSDADEEALDTLFAARWPTLRTLQIAGCRFVDELVAALVRGPLIDRLTELDLRDNALGAAHVEALTKRAPNVKLFFAAPA